ncbi:type II and III secretion system protein family protein [Allosphingosinicella sp.]|uniref:type II and III secretion system protein family protein n=1 Tax=Allosphingosinicella sp. TaxID=2823234 RepID=UPI002EEB92C5
MTKRNIMSRAILGTAVAALALGIGTVAAPAPSAAQPSAGTYRPTKQVLLSVGEGQLISLPRNVVDVWTSNPGVADVNVSNPRQIGLFGKEAGEATVIATAADGSVVYGAAVRVSQNISSVDQVLRAAMPDAQITVTHVGQVAVINGTVASPADSAQAEQLIRTLLNPGIDTSAPGALLKVVPINRLKTATPLQVMLQVKVAEVSRSLVREIGMNLLTRDQSGGFLFGLSRGRSPGTIKDVFSPSVKDAMGMPVKVGEEVTFNSGQNTTISGAAKLLGLDVLGALDLAETDGRVRTLAEPSLTALSGETASFLAGGEFPIPMASGLNGTSIEFKEYGVSLAFTPTVLEDGRISMRVRPEVSELSKEGAILVGGFSIPGLTTRRAETTVELGSGQSFMIGGLLRNSSAAATDKAPLLGNLPILGALFRSNSFKRNETELVIVVTPYLVRPVNAGQIALPTDGFRSSSTMERVFLDKQEKNRSGEARPGPTMAQAQVAGPGMSSLPQPPRTPNSPAPRQQAKQQAVKPEQTAAAAPGFSF